MIFLQKLDRIIKKNNSLVCVGLDSDITKIPKHLRTKSYPQFYFNRSIIDATHDLVCAYKPNLAFYEARGPQGLKELKMTIDYLHKHHSRIVTIADAKRGDIGSSNHAYISSIFDWFGFDAITLHPYAGQEALQPFLNRKDKGLIIFCRSSNPGASEFQDLKINGKPLYQIVAHNVVQKWNKNQNCLLVAGATYPRELKAIRKIVGDMFLLIPGIGTQGGDIQKIVEAGKNSQGSGMIINSSRAIIFASTGKNFTESARQTTFDLRNTVNLYR